MSTNDNRVASFKFAQFDVKTEEWRYYVQRFQLEVTVQSITSKTDQRNLLLKCIGPTAYKLVVDHFDPVNVLEKSYDDILAFLNEYYKPTTNYLSERINFGMCMRTDKQTITQFVEDLRSRAVFCEFGNTLDERLRDQFLLGINNSAMREAIFSKHPDRKTTLNDVVTTAMNLEAAQHQRSMLDKQQSNITSNTESTSVNKVRPYKVETKQTTSTIDASKICLSCGRKLHDNKEQCPASKSTCRLCGRQGHWNTVCLKSGKFKVINGKPPKKFNKNFDKGGKSASINEVTLEKVYKVNASSAKLLIDVSINGIVCAMEYDSAAAVSTIDEETWQRIGSPKLSEGRRMSAYTNIPLVTLGEATVNVSVNGRAEPAVVCVIKGEATPLFGLNWMKQFNLIPKHELLRMESIQNSTNAVNQDVSNKEEIENIMRKCSNLFSTNFNTASNFEAHINLKENAIPVIARARPVPFALKPKVEAELDRMVKCGMIEPIDPTKTPNEWASPIVIKEKKNGDVRVIGDFKTTVNPNVKSRQYSFPLVEESLNKLNGFKEFSKVDLKDAFMQLRLALSAQKILVIITHKGYYRFLTLPLGYTESPLIFQEFMDALLSDIDGVAVFQDDVATGGRNRKDHLERLHKVLTRLNERGLRTQINKVAFFQVEITFLGHRLNKDGIRPTTDRVAALRKLPAPKNQRELKSFLGSAIQYNKFVPNLLELCGPLYKKEKTGSWQWTPDDQRQFEKIKNAITADKVLAYYNPDLPVILTTDASEQGVGAVLEHQYPDGHTRIIAAASRVLSPTEKRYSTMDREALAIMFGVGKFELYLFGRHFILRTDHQPLRHIFGENTALPKLAITRLARWAIALTSYKFTVQYKPGKENYTADMLSRLPVDSADCLSEFEKRNYVNINTISVLRETISEQLTLTQRTIRTKTIEDPVLSKGMNFCKTGWPERKKLPSEAFNTFYEKREEITIEDGILLWHDRIIIPEKLRPTILANLHKTHLGSCAMRSIAKIVIWWPNCDREIETFVSNCATCQKYQPQEPETPLNLWTIPTKPWTRIHIDFTGPFQGKQWFVIIDAFSNWLEIFPVASASSTNVIKVLRCLIARYGVCNQIVSDNGTQFCSEEFKNFCKANNIELIHTTPYHSRSNGKVERAIRTFKWRYKKTEDQILDSDHRLQAVLFAYRTTPHSATGRTPAELFLGRPATSKLELLKPNISSHEGAYQEKMKAYADRNKNTERNFEVGEEVWHKNKNEATWKPAVIKKKTGLLSYRIEDEDKNKEVRVHADQLRRSGRKKFV